MIRFGIGLSVFIAIVASLALVTATPSGAIFTRNRSVTSNTFSTATTFPAVNTVERANNWTTTTSHTAGSGPNRLLVLVISYEGLTDTGITSITWGTRSMTRAVGVVAGTGNYNRVEIWYLNESNITSATNNNFVVTWTSGTPADPMYAAATFKNVNQATPIATTNSAATDFSTPNPITAAVSVTAGQMVIAGVNNGNSGGYTWNNSFIERTDQTSGATTTSSTAEKATTASGTQTASATHDNSLRQALAVAVLNHDTVETLTSWTTGLSHTMSAGTNRLLVFAVSYENAADVPVSSVTYGTQSLTRAVGAVAGSSTFGRVELWYLNEAGIAAASNSSFVVTWGGSSPSAPTYAAAAYERVYQGSPIGEVSSNTAESSTPNPITVSAAALKGDRAVSAVISGNSGSYTWNNGFSERTDQTGGATQTTSTADDLATSDGTSTASATHSGPNRQAIVVAVLQPD